MKSNQEAKKAKKTDASASEGFEKVSSSLEDVLVHLLKDQGSQKTHLVLERVSRRLRAEGLDIPPKVKTP